MFKKPSKNLAKKYQLFSKKNKNYHLKANQNQYNLPSEDDELNLKKIPKIKFKLPFFYKISFSLTIFIGIILFYFLVLVSSKPREIKYITDKIQNYLTENFENSIKIKETLVNFTYYGSFKVAINQISIAYQDIKIDDQNNKIYDTKFLNIPRIEGEFSLFEILRLRFSPVKVKIIRPEIFIDNPNGLSELFKGSSSSADNQQLSTLIGFLSSLRKNKNPIENFEIENAKILIFNSKIQSEITIENAKINSKLNKDTLDIFIQSLIFVSRNKSEFKLDSNCKLSKIDGLKCDANIYNFMPNSLVGFHPIFDDLDNLETNISGLLNLTINPNKSFNNLKFKVQSEKGSFYFKEFFKDKIDFKQMSVDGDYNGIDKVLNFNNIETELVSKIANQTEISNPKLKLSLQLSLPNRDKLRYEFNIGLKNALINEIDRFWPLNLSQNGIRNWVLNSIKNGTMNDGFVKFIIDENLGESELKSLNAQFDFKNTNLTYDKNFPEISNINGLAFFSKNDMKIFVKSGDVLKSKINNAEISIADFNMPTNILNIKGNIEGKAFDGLKHASNHPDFLVEVENYLNGNAKSSFEISVPLIDNLALKDVFLAVKSDISDLKNEFTKGDLSIDLKKDFGVDIFKTDINLDKASLDISELMIEKTIKEKGGLSFDLDLTNAKILNFKNIKLTKGDVEKKQNFSSIIGELALEYNPFKILKINLKNQNFGKNNYDFAYNLNQKNSALSIDIKGKYLNLKNIFTHQVKSNQKFSLDKILANKVNVNINLSGLELKSNAKYNNVMLNLSCQKGICQSGSLLTSLNKGKNQIKNIALKISKNPKKDKVNEYILSGQIADVGTLVEGLDITNLIGDGNIKIDITQKLIDEKLNLEGSIKSTSEITIYENEKVKKLAKDNLYSKVKDKIFSSEKTTFGSLNIDFALVESDLIVKSLIANNYKIGITAKGNINLHDNSMQLKGMIVPGYLVNSLFGLSKVPVLGSVIKGLLTGEDGGGIFSVRYEYVRQKNQSEGEFKTNAVSAFVPSSISSLFD